MGINFIPAASAPSLSYSIPIVNQVIPSGLTLRATYTSSASGLTWTTTPVFAVVIGGGGGGQANTSGGCGGGAVVMGWCYPTSFVTVGAGGSYSDGGYSYFGGLLAMGGQGYVYGPVGVGAGSAGALLSSTSKTYSVGVSKFLSANPGGSAWRSGITGFGNGTSGAGGPRGNQPPWGSVAQYSGGSGLVGGGGGFTWDGSTASPGAPSGGSGIGGAGGSGQSSGAANAGGGGAGWLAAGGNAPSTSQGGNGGSGGGGAGNSTSTPGTGGAGCVLIYY